MKKFIIAVTAAGLALAASSASAAGSYYLQGNVGYGFNAKQKYALANALQGNISYTSSTQSTGKGTLGSVALGYKSTHFRSELELYADDGLKSKGKSFGSVVNAKTDVKSFGGFVNAYFDMANSTKFTPFVGAGLGYLSNQGKVTGTDTFKAFNFKVKKAKIAYKLVAGVSYEFAKNMSVLAQYQYMDKGKFHKANVKFASTSHAAMLGVRFGF